MCIADSGKFPPMRYIAKFKSPGGGILKVLFI